MRRDEGLREGRDYLAFYDSTVARFWPRDPETRRRLEARLDQHGGGERVGAERLREWGVDFADHRYGEVFYLVPPGSLLVPSHMGSQPLRGMHGYTPEDPGSDAVLLRSDPAPESVAHIKDVRLLLESEIVA
jgi:hypothetical protein